VKVPSTTAVVRIFRVLALAEAFSWAALLAGMYFKWIAKSTELGVEIAGPIHGALFIGYGLAALVLWRLQRWPFRVALFAGFSAVLPFATVLFERWAGGRGYLTTAGTTPAGRQTVAEKRDIRERAGEETADV
jgi:integral membrane protein